MFGLLVRQAGATDAQYLEGIVKVIGGQALSSVTSLDQGVSTVGGAANPWAIDHLESGTVSAPTRAGTRRKVFRLGIMAGTTVGLKAIDDWNPATQAVGYLTAATEAADLSLNQVVFVASDDVILVASSNYGKYALGVECQEDYPSCKVGAGSCWGTVTSNEFRFSSPKAKLPTANGFAVSPAVIDGAIGMSSIVGGRNSLEVAFNPMVSQLIWSASYGPLGYLRGVWATTYGNSGTLMTSDEGDVYLMLKKYGSSVSIAIRRI